MFNTLIDILLIFLSVIGSIKTFAYSIYEIKVKQNKFGGVLTIVINSIVFLLVVYVIIIV